MDADERLRALKKAYADIILNSAKEAAARIMVSERKSLRFQHDLGVAKEQALQMLLRLKLMMDSKVSEAGVTYLSQQREIEELKAQLREAENTMNGAEATSLSQQRKIEELEAQLHEAEDIVKDLREELREVQAELERVRNSKLQQMDEHEIATQEQTSHENRLNSSRSVIFPPPESRLESFTASDRKNPAFNQRNEVYKCYKNLGNSCIGKPNLPSTSKEQRLNTSQSITLPPPESRLEPFTAYDVKNLGFSQRNDVYKCHGANDFHMGNSNVSKPNLPSIILRSKDPGPYRNRRTQRIRAFEEKLMAGELSFSETIDDVNYETSEKEDGGGEGVCKTPIPTEKKYVVRANSASYQLQKVKPVRRKRRRFTRYKKTKTLSSGPLYNQALQRDQTSDIPCTEAYSVNNNAHTGEDPSNMASRLAADTTEKGTSLGCTKVTGGYANLDKAVRVDSTTNKDKASTEKLLLTGQESGSSDSSEVPIGRMDVEKVEEPIVNSLAKTSCTTNGIPYQPVTDRVIKYTFQRKRKKGSLSSSDGNASLEKSILKKIAVEKQNDPLESEKSSSITETSRDSRRLAQGARQLVSLSEKKWWQ